VPLGDATTKLCWENRENWTREQFDTQNFLKTIFVLDYKSGTIWVAFTTFTDIL
jgi:hypothetical protein